MEARLTGCEDCRYIFSADGKYILGGMMVGDTADYVRLLALVKKKVPYTPHLFRPIGVENVLTISCVCCVCDEWCGIT